MSPILDPAAGVATGVHRTPLRLDDPDCFPVLAKPDVSGARANFEPIRHDSIAVAAETALGRSILKMQLEMAGWALAFNHQSDSPLGILAKGLTQSSQAVELELTRFRGQVNETRS